MTDLTAGEPKFSSNSAFSENFTSLDVEQKLNDKLIILVCSTGSVATVKLPEILTKLNVVINDADMHVIMTERAKHFCKIDEISSLATFHDDSEWKKNPCLHEELAQKASILLISPLDANTLAKIANGLCDNLLTSIVRSWNFDKIAICSPAMNTQMWNHPITEVHIKELQSFGFLIIPPITKKLACGDFGVGAMAEPKDIVLTVQQYAEKKNARKEKS